MREEWDLRVGDGPERAPGSPGTPSDASLLALAKGSDIGAAAALFIRHRGMVRGIVVRLGVPRDDVDDVVQVAFARFFRELPRVSYVSGFLAVSAKWAAQNALRADRRRGRLATALGGMLATRVPRRQEDGIVVRLDVREAFARLDARCRELLRATVMEGTSQRSFAEGSGTPIGTIGPRIGRCLEKMRRHLADVRRPAGTSRRRNGRGGGRAGGR